jgi:hypothetical protein
MKDCLLKWANGIDYWPVFCYIIIDIKLINIQRGGEYDFYT